MARPQFGSVRAQTFVAGNDPEARQVVQALAEEVGFEALDCGAMVAARTIEAVGALWCHLAHVQQRGGPGGQNISPPPHPPTPALRWADSSL